MSKHSALRKYSVLFAIIIAVVLGLVSVTSFAQAVPTDELTEITDQEVLKKLSEGDFTALQEVTVAEAPQYVMGYTIRHHWSYSFQFEEWLQVYVNNTTSQEFTDFKIIAQLQNGGSVERLTSANLTPKYELFLKDGSNTDPVDVTVLPSNGGISESYYYSDVCTGPMVSISRWSDGQTTYAVVHNTEPSRPIHFRIVGLSDWATVEAGKYHAYGTKLQAALVEIKMEKSEEAPVCMRATWDWRNPAPVVATLPQMRALKGEVVKLPIVIGNAEGQRGFEGVIDFDPTKLEFVGKDSNDTMSAGIQSSANLTETGKISWGVVSPMAFTESKNGGVLLYLDFVAKGKYEETTEVKLLDFYTSPDREVSVSNSIITFGSNKAEGYVLDSLKNPLVDTQFSLRGPGWGYSGPVGPDGKFELPITPRGQYTLEFYPFSIDRNRIGIEDIQNGLDCRTSAIECDFLTADANKDGLLNIDDMLCIADFWLGKPNQSCYTGTYRYDDYPSKFDNFTPGLTNMVVTGRLIGDVLLTNPDVEVAAQAEPTLEVVETHEVAGGANVTFKVTGQDLRVVGLELSENVGNASAANTPQWNANRVLLMSESPQNETTVTVFIPLENETEISVNIHYAGGVVQTAATFIVGPGPTPILFLYLPNMHRGITIIEEEMPELGFDFQVFIPKAESN